MKVLVRGTNWIGDAVMSVPALKELRRILPDAEITLHTRTWAEGIFADAPFIDELVTYDKGRWAAKDVLDNSKFLKGDGYDLAVLLPNSFESALTSFLSSIPRRFGYNKDLRGLLLTDPIAVPEWKHRRHEVFYYLNLISELEKRLLGCDTVSAASPDASLFVPESKRVAAGNRLTRSGLQMDRPLIALGVGSTNSIVKRWPLDSFISLVFTVVSQLDAQVILVGSKGEVSHELSSVAPGDVFDLTGKTSLDEAVAILSIADLMVSNDMGLAHVAAAVRTPTIVLFGPTDPTTTRPWGDNVTVLQREVRCEYCEKGDQTSKHICTRWLSVEEVFDVIAAQLTIGSVFNELEVIREGTC